MDKFKALIIGCGNIGSHFDVERDDDICLTHVKALQRHGGFNIIGGVDTNDNRLSEFQNKWGVENLYTSIQQAVEDGLRPDYIAICTPTETHKNIILDAQRLNPKLIVCEKPFTLNSSDAKEIKEKAQCPIFINYQRRHTKIVNSTWRGVNLYPQSLKLQNFVGFYTGTLLNCGVHMLDLLQFMFGPLTPKAATKKNYMYSDGIDCYLETAQGNSICMLAMNNSCYKSFDMIFNFQDGQVVVEDSSRYVRKGSLIDDLILPGKKLMYHRYASDYYLSMEYLARNIFYFLETGKNDITNFKDNSFYSHGAMCTMDEAIRTHELVESLLQLSDGTPKSH